MKAAIPIKDRVIAILLVLGGCIAINAFTANPFNYRTDGIAHVGFPLTVYEIGGYVYRNQFRLDALAIDLLVAFAVTAICVPAIECRLRSNAYFSPTFPLTTLLLCVSLVGVLLGLQHQIGIVHVFLQRYGPIIAIALAYLISIRLGKETRASSFILLIVSFAGVYFAITYGGRTATDNVLILLHYWTLPLWMIWFVAMVDIDQFLPEVSRESDDAEIDS